MQKLHNLDCKKVFQTDSKKAALLVLGFCVSVQPDRRTKQLQRKLLLLLLWDLVPFSEGDSSGKKLSTMTAELLPRAAAELNIIKGSRNDIEMLSTSTSSGPDSSNHKKGRRSGDGPPAAASAGGGGGGGSTQKREQRQQRQQQQQQQTPAEHEENGQKQKRKSSSAQLSIEAANMLLYTVRRSLISSCHSMQEEDEEEEEEEIVQRRLQAPVIEWPTHVQHIAHVTFDRYNGFLGLPEEFKIEVPLRPPSARFVIYILSKTPFFLSGSS
jgi:hypothetical protein